VPFGYRRIDQRTLELDPKQAKRVQFAFQKYASELCTDGEIARMINDQGYRTKNKTGEAPFAKDSVRGLLTNPFYTGVVMYKGEIFPGRHPAIIGQETFDKVLRLRRKRYAGWKGFTSQGPRTYPAAGLLECEECGTRCQGRTTRNTRLIGRDGCHPSEFRSAPRARFDESTARARSRGDPSFPALVSGANCM